MEAVEDHALRLVAIDLRARGRDEFLLPLLGGTQRGFQIARLVLQRLVPREALFDFLRLGGECAGIGVARFLLRELRLRSQLLQRGLEPLHLVAGEHAGVIAVLVILLIRGGEDRGQLGEAQPLALHLREHLGELALEDVVVRNQLRTPAAEGHGFELRLEELEVSRERAAHLMIREESLPGERRADAAEQKTAQLIDIAPVLPDRRERLDVREIRPPPFLQRGEKAGVRDGKGRVGLHDLRQRAAVGDGRGEIRIDLIAFARRKDTLAQAVVIFPEMRERPDLHHGHATVDVCAHVVRLRRRSIVHVAADVAVPALGFDLAHRHEPRVGINVLPLAIDVDDLRDVLRPEEVLRLAFAKLAVGIDEEDVLPLRRALLIEDQNARRDAGAVEKPRRQPDDCLQPAVPDEMPARLLFLSAAEEHAVRHDRGHFSVRLRHREHVLHKHEVGLLALFRHPDSEASGILDVLPDVILAERRIGGHAVVAGQLAALGLVLRAAQCVFLADVSRLNPVKEHVHFADGPRGAHALLPGERKIARISTALADVVARLDQHAAGTDGGIIDAHARLRVEDFDDDADDIGWRVELARLFAGGIGEVFDEVFVGRAEEVGELEVLIAQGDLLEVLDEVRERVVVERALADFPVEVDALEHVLKLIDIRVFESFERLVQPGADVGLQMPDVRPARVVRDEEGVFVRVRELRRNHVRAHPARLEILRELLLFLIEEVAQPLQEEHAENVFLVLRRIHVPAQVVARAKKKGRELAEREFLCHPSGAIATRDDRV